jgi:hypothetical protein
MLAFPRLATACLLGVAVLAVSARAAEVDKFLPDKTEAVLTVNVKQLLHGGLVKKHALEPLQLALKDSGEVHDILESVGIDPFQDIDRIVGAATAGEKGYEVAIVHGRFDTAQFLDGAKQLTKDKSDVVKMHKSGDNRYFEVVAPGNHGSLLFGAGAKEGKDGLAPAMSLTTNGSPLDMTGSFFFALVDKSTLVLATDKQGVLDAFDRSAKPRHPSLKKSMRQAIEDADSKQTIWLVTRMSAFASKDAEADGEEQEEPNGIDRIQGGITLGDDLKVHFALTAVNIDAAKEVMKDLDDLRTRAAGLATLLAGNQKDCACLKDIPQAFKATRKGKTITVEGQLEGELLEQVIGLMQRVQ